MAMNGAVAVINQSRGMVAVRTEQGFSIFEIRSVDSFEVGDEVSWDDDTARGGEVIFNHTQGFSVEVYFQNHHVGESQVRQQLFTS
jgi:hypothetical protein